MVEHVFDDSAFLVYLVGDPCQNNFLEHNSVRIDRVK